MKIRLIVVCAFSALVIAACSNNARVGSCEGACSVGMICNTASGECVSTSPIFPGSGLPCDVAAVLQNHCLSCHGSQPAGGAPNSLVTRTQLLSASPAGGTYAVRAALRMRDMQSPMPPSSSGDMVSAEERAIFENWVTANYPGGSCTDANATASGGGDGATGGGDGTTGGGDGATGGGDGTTGGGDGADGGASTGGGIATQGGGAATQGGGTGAAGGGVGSTGGGTGTTSAYCAPCTSDTDCGGNGNFCIGFTFGDYCGTDCTSVTCATGERCANIVDSSNTVLGKNCVPVTGATCTSPAGGGTGTSGGGSGTSGGGTGTTGGGSATTGGGTGTTDAGVCTTDTWSSWAQNFFNTKCNSCHSHTGEFTHTRVISSKSTITSYISSGVMPQGSTLSSADKQRVLQYLNCGAP